MPCYHPVTGWRCAAGVFFKPTPDSSQIQLPCGRCIGCRLDRSRQWAMRLVHELRFHDKSSFITLTYNDSHLPPGGTLVLKHFQDFMKRLRRELHPAKIRFFHAGEYGEKKGRPHYHAIIFGEDFDCSLCRPKYSTHLIPTVPYHVCESYSHRTSERGDTTWCHPVLDKLWSDKNGLIGEARVGRVSFESCAYVARYITKKITGPNAQKHYERIDFNTGEVFNLKPEYATMSRRPGIGYAHFEKYSSEIYPSDTVVCRGHLVKPPKFYDKLLEKANTPMYERIKEAREFALTLSVKSNKTPSRLAVSEEVKLAQIGQLKRSYEIG